MYKRFDLQIRDLMEIPTPVILLPAAPTPLPACHGWRPRHCAPPYPAVASSKVSEARFGTAVHQLTTNQNSLAHCIIHIRSTYHLHPLSPWRSTRVANIWLPSTTMVALSYFIFKITGELTGSVAAFSLLLLPFQSAADT